MNPRIVLIPLDSRPVNVLLPAQMSETVGYKVITPPVSILGNLDSLADSAAVAKWALESAKKFPSETFVVSSDMISYGGLVWSRKNLVSPAQAEKNIRLILRLKKAAPDSRVFVSGTIPRDAMTVHGASDMKSWAAQMSGGSIRKSSPERRRNIDILFRLIEMTADGTIDYLYLGKEDTAAGNPFASELEKLEKAISSGAMTERAAIAAGADEIGCILVARAIATCAGKRPSIHVKYSGMSKGHTPRYEPFPFGKTIETQIRGAGGISGGKSSDSTLVIHGNGGGQETDAFLRQMEGRDAQGKISAAKKTAGIIESLVDDGIATGLVDAELMNSSSPALMQNLIERGLFFRLASYAGWNTAANSSGTVIAHLVAMSCGARINRQKHINYLAARLAEDFVYSCAARKRLVASSANPTAATGNIAAGALKKMMAEEAASRELDITIKKAKLPWGRLFEVETDCAVK